MSSTKASSVEDKEIAVGNPAAISLAKVGPERTANEISSPKISRATSCNNRPVSCSKPFVAQTKRASFLRKGFICVSISPKTWLGTTNKIFLLAAITLAKSLVTTNASGKELPGKYFSFARELAISAT